MNARLQLPALVASCVAMRAQTGAISLVRVRRDWRQTILLKSSSGTLKAVVATTSRRALLERAWKKFLSGEHAFGLTPVREFSLLLGFICGLSRSSARTQRAPATQLYSARPFPRSGNQSFSQKHQRRQTTRSLSLNMMKLSLSKSFLLALFLCLGAANVPAQEPQTIPPPPAIYYTVPPPDADTLPPPPQFTWDPLGPKDEGGAGNTVEQAIIPPPVADPVVPPPPPPIIETPGERDPNAMELVRPEVEIWRGDSQWPQIPARFSNWLNPAYVTGTQPVTLLVQFNSAAVGRKVLVRAGLGITVDATGSAPTITANGDHGEYFVQAQLAQGFNRSHVNFYCDGVKTVLPVVRASLATVEQVEEETGGGN
jgi:hypothetical protein